MKNTFQPDRESDILITCLPGLGEVLRSELEGRGKTVEESSSKFARIRGTIFETYALNYHLRTASHIHYLLTSFLARNADDLYKMAKEFPWESIIPENGYFSIHSVVRNDSIKDNRFANLRLKDAIADRFAIVKGKRPNSGPDNSGVVIYLHWINNKTSIYVDTSGESLSRRGYRKDPWKAPLAESLAAGIMLSTQWDRKSAILNPMGGSGTLVIEALLLSRGIPPGSFRANFGFKQLMHYDPDLWGKTKVKPSEYKDVHYPVVYNDNKRFAIKALERNLATSGLDKNVRTFLGDFKKMRIPEGPGIVILNPPYGERLGEIAELETLYTEIGDFFKQKCVNYTGYVFTANRELAKNIGLRASSKKVFYNAKMEARLFEYPLYSGSKSTSQ